jgi:hypothetical protein
MATAGQATGSARSPGRWREFGQFLNAHVSQTRQNGTEILANGNVQPPIGRPATLEANLVHYSMIKTIFVSPRHKIPGRLIDKRIGSLAKLPLSHGNRLWKSSP